MTPLHRLPEGGRIDRRRVLEFTFDGHTYLGYAGDTLASALLANGVRCIGRSARYHRPRGIHSADAHTDTAVQVGRGARITPQQAAACTELYEGLTAASLAGWPGLEHDVLAASDWLARLRPAGYQHKTLIYQAPWRLAEPWLRRFAGLGRAPVHPDPDRYDKMNAHCDVLIIGAGPAGLAAALTAGRSGARVILADAQTEPGGSLLTTRATLDDRPAGDWLARTVRELRALPELRLLTRTTAFGWHDHHFVTLLERRSDHLPPGVTDGPRQRLWRVRARQIIVATGAVERPLVFGNNDRPGVMAASAVSAYLNRYAVTPGQRAVVFTNNDSAYRTVLDLLAARVEVAAVVDTRPHPNGALSGQVRARGVTMLAGHAVVDAQGYTTVEGARVMRLTAMGDAVIPGAVQGIACDLIAVSGGWNPALDLYVQAGGRRVWDKLHACYLPTSDGPPAQVAGAANGCFDLNDALADGVQAAAAATQAAGYTVILPTLPHSTYQVEEPLRPLWRTPSPYPPGRGPKAFVDWQHDVTVTDLQLAAREGFSTPEPLSRYTGLGGTNLTALAILAETLGGAIADLEPTIPNPPAVPVAFGALAGETDGRLYAPLHKTPLDAWHAEHGAVFELVGAWRRPHCCPRLGESAARSVSRECLAVRNSVGLLDAGTLGRIDVQGADALTLLERVYTNHWHGLAVGRCRYGLMLDDSGRLYDDGIVARLGERHYVLTTNAGQGAQVFMRLERWLQTAWTDLKVYLTDVSERWTTLVLAGPNSRRVLARLCEDIDFSRAEFPYLAVRTGTVAGVAARLLRVGFCGELGFELNVPAAQARTVWEALLAAGAEFNITAYGAEALRVLRAEKGYIIISQDTDASVLPQDLGLDGLLAQDKDYLGKRALALAISQQPQRRHWVGLLTRDPQTVLPAHAPLMAGPRNKFSRPPIPTIGHITASYYSACLGHSIALALVAAGRDRIGQAVHVALPDGSSTPALVTRPSFYDPEGGRQND